MAINPAVSEIPNGSCKIRTSGGRSQPVNQGERPVNALRARGVESEVEDLTSGARVEVDPSQLNQLLLNLIQNALAAMDEVSRVAEGVLRELVR